MLLLLAQSIKAYPALELNSGTVLHALSMLGGVKISNSNMVDRTRREQERVNYKRLNSRSSADFFGLFPLALQRGY